MHSLMYMPQLTREPTTVRAASAREIPLNKFPHSLSHGQRFLAGCKDPAEGRGNGGNLLRGRLECVCTCACLLSGWKRGLAQNGETFRYLYQVPYLYNIRCPVGWLPKRMMLLISVLLVGRA